MYRVGTRGVGGYVDKAVSPPLLPSALPRLLGSLTPAQTPICLRGGGWGREERGPQSNRGPAKLWEGARFPELVDGWARGGGAAGGGRRRWWLGVILAPGENQCCVKVLGEGAASGHWGVGGGRSSG